MPSVPCVRPKAHQDDRFAARYDAPGQHIYAPALLKRLSELAPADAVIACDVGQHQMWVAQHCRFSHPRNHLTSGALGTMGFGLPAAMGAQFACPERTVVLVSGDGSFMMNVQELATIARCRLPVKIVLLDNSSLGMVRQWQELFFAERYSEIDLSDNPDFVALAQVFGIAATRIDARDDVEGGLAALLAEPGPALLHVAIDARANVWPLVPPNTANSTMLESNPAHARQETPMHYRLDLVLHPAEGALLRVIGMAAAASRRARSAVRRWPPTMAAGTCSWWWMASARRKRCAARSRRSTTACPCRSRPWKEQPHEHPYRSDHGAGTEASSSSSVPACGGPPHRAGGPCRPLTPTRKAMSAT